MKTVYTFSVVSKEFIDAIKMGPRAMSHSESSELQIQICRAVMTTPQEFAYYSTVMDGWHSSFGLFGENMRLHLRESGIDFGRLSRYRYLILRSAVKVIRPWKNQGNYVGKYADEMVWKSITNMGSFMRSCNMVGLIVGTVIGGSIGDDEFRKTPKIESLRLQGRH